MSDDVRQQRRRDEIAADEPDQACDQRQRHQLDQQHAIEHARRHPAGAQGAQHRQPLLEGEPDCGIDDEQADEERQHSECSEVEVKTVSQAFEIAFRAGLDVAELVAGHSVQRRARRPGLADQQPRNLIRHLQESLRDTDIDHQHAGHQVRLRAKRWQGGAAVRRWRSAFRKVQLGQRLRATSISPGGVTKACRFALPIAGALPTSDGRVTGSMPSRRNDRPEIWMRPSRTGDTGQPARRRSTNSFCGKVALVRLTSIAVRAPPKVATRAS
jgi:hypothetical protein